MNRLAQCPECGGVTHPLAAELLADKLASSKADAAREDKPIADPAPDAVLCGNCAGPIGKLQNPLEWDGHSVCLVCYRELSLAKAAAENPVQSTTALAAQPGNVVTEFHADALPARAPTIIADMASHGALQFTLAFWGACLGLCATALAIFLIVMILRSVGVLILWGAAIVASIAAYYWVRRGILALRFPRKVRQVRAIVRN
ncbi:MAG TPA: hypothetical protein VG326_14975 [Tepidisphaeraceae bacterium]|nr:hypothetical protein [Tepidisphaeraceae bacterium]